MVSNVVVIEDNDIRNLNLCRHFQWLEQISKPFPTIIIVGYKYVAIFDS